MNRIQEVAFDWLVNASVQIGIFSLMAAALSPFIAKAKARSQHGLYLALLVLCLTAPLVNTLWPGAPRVAETGGQQNRGRAAEQSSRFIWDWNGHSEVRTARSIAPGAKTAILTIWQMAFLWQLIRFGRSLSWVRRLRREAEPVSPGLASMAETIWPRRFVVLQSTTIDDPVTIGMVAPAIFLPAKLVPSLSTADLEAVFAHEYGHICRYDFAVHLVCRITTLPIAWHPGIQYLMSKISQTRELACDEYATTRLGRRTAYARTLLRLASLCLQVPRRNTMELGFFNGDNLEDRIMKLTEKRTSLSRAGVVLLASATFLVFGSSAVVARATSLQEASATARSLGDFAGTWHWMFQGHSFSTMVLTWKNPGYTGSVTPSRIALDERGELSKADPSENSRPASITKTKTENDGLRVTVEDGKETFEFVVTLKDATHAEIHPVGAPANMKPIQAERIN